MSYTHPLYIVMGLVSLFYLVFMQLWGLLVVRGKLGYLYETNENKKKRGRTYE